MACRVVASTTAAVRERLYLLIGFCQSCALAAITLFYFYTSQRVDELRT
jgi:hypothetical protein